MSMLPAEAPFRFVAASSLLVVAGTDPSTVADGAVVEFLGDRDGEVGEVDVLVLGARPTGVATYPRTIKLDIGLLDRHGA